MPIPIALIAGAIGQLLPVILKATQAVGYLNETGERMAAEGRTTFTPEEKAKIDGYLSEAQDSWNERVRKARERLDLGG